jgi:hypothetical protein
MHNAWIGNPAWRLVQALATMKGKNEETVVPGFYDQVQEPGAEELALLQDLEKTFDAQAILPKLTFAWYRIWTPDKWWKPCGDI